VVEKVEYSMCDFHYLSSVSVLTHKRGYAIPNHNGKLLLVSNLKDGIDEYRFPSMEKVQTFVHPIETNCIIQTRTLPSWNLIVTGGDDGFTRVFNRISGQLISEIIMEVGMPPLISLSPIRCVVNVLQLVASSYRLLR